MFVRHLNQRQLARRWCMSPRTLERWRWTGEGPRFLKLGGRIVYREDDVEAYEADHLHASTSKPVTNDQHSAGP
jgi:hypothetical protein